MEQINAIGRRKEAIARLYVTEGKGNMTINGMEAEKYFTTPLHRYAIYQALELTGERGNYDVKVKLNGGGVKGQSEALRLALARALCKINPEHRPVLKGNGLLTRDPRQVERKKPGRPKARKRFQFSKR